MPTGSHRLMPLGAPANHAPRTRAHSQAPRHPHGPRHHGAIVPIDAIDTAASLDGERVLAPIAREQSAATGSGGIPGAADKMG